MKPSLGLRRALHLMTRLFTCLIGLNFLGVTALAATGSSSSASTEEIEGLLRYIAKLEAASFVRNGDAHTLKEAEAHLRLKWGQQKKEIQTAEDFIRLCASKSSLSGKAYTIKFKDGHEEESAMVLAKELAAIRSSTKRS